MKITLLTVGKTTEKYLVTGIEKYIQRLKYYISFHLIELPELKNTKNLTKDQQKKMEASLVLKNINSTDHLILLDEKGEQYSSIDFASLINKKATNRIQHIIFLIGGPYGFDSSIYARANNLLSLSKMTFSHQMVRLFLVEQLYRSFTILKGEPYHHA